MPNRLLSSRPADAWRVFDEAFTRKLQSAPNHDADPLAPEKEGAAALCRAAEAVLRARLEALERVAEAARTTVDKVDGGWRIIIDDDYEPLENLDDAISALDATGRGEEEA